MALVEANARDVLSYLRRRTDSPEDAADLLSETLAVAWRRIGDLPPDELRARMWLFATARNVLANHRRSARRAGDLAARLRELLAVEHDASGSGSTDTAADAVREAIKQLPADQQELVTLVHWDGFTLAHAAQIVGVPASTARSRYAAARTQLGRLLHVQLGTRTRAPSTVAPPSRPTGSDATDPPPTPPRLPVDAPAGADGQLRLPSPERPDRERVARHRSSLHAAPDRPGQAGDPGS